MQERKLLKRKQKATSEGNVALLASTCIDLAELYCQEERYLDAIGEYTIVADCYKQTGKELDYARANRMIGEAYMQLREFDKALSYHQIYLRVAKEQNDKLEEQRALATIGYTHLTQYLDNLDNPNRTCLNSAYKSFMKSLIVCESLTNISKYEHKDMMARLLANLGLVHECQGEYDKGIELIRKSIVICKAYDLYEQLERDYSLLGSLFLRKSEYNNALSQYNLAIEIAKRLKNKVPLMCGSLVAKADILIKLSDYHSAKTVLLKAHKLKHPILSERDTIQHNLKVVAAMCYTEDSLLAADNFDYKTKKCLYEKLGDGACNLKCYGNAIDYYKKMLEAAKSNGDSNSDLSPCYISLAETYRDNKQFDLAIRYFQEDYNLGGGNVKERVGTLLNIADCMEASHKDMVKVEEVYDQARNECITAGDKKLEAKVVVRHVAMLRTNGRLSQAALLEKDLERLEYLASDSESELSEEQATPDIGDDISIENITDVSDESDEENTSTNTVRATRKKRGKSMIVKRNNKGETQLHTACISGNSELVKRLLDQGHPVNIRDNCGWLPIHEACICGHLGIVEMLIEKGALINDRGGSLCNGMTPLHDAASNGHLEIIQYLLDKGASAISKNDIGETPFHILKRWRLSNDSEPGNEALYDLLINRFTESLEKLGHVKDVIVTGNTNPALVCEGESFTTQQTRRQRSSDIHNREKSQGTFRRNPSDELTPSTSSKLSCSRRRRCNSSGSSDDCSDIVTSTLKKSRATDEYKRVMENLRHPPREENAITAKRKSSDSGKKSAHLEPDEVGDDWLEDDLSINASKKRKIVSRNALITTVGARKVSPSTSLRRYSSSSSIKSRNDDFEVPAEFFDTDFQSNQPRPDEIFIESDDEFENLVSGMSLKKRKSQTSLLDQNFTRNRSFSPNNPTCSTSGNVGAGSQRKHQTKLSNFGISKVSDEMVKNVAGRVGAGSHFGLNSGLGGGSALSSGFGGGSTLSVDVRIDGKLYRVPVMASELNVKTIKWLADEAAQRYSRKECIKPTLELETKNGAVLADDDHVSILFIPGSIQAEEVHARITKWNLPSLPERYTEACSNTNIEPQEEIIKLLRETSSYLNLSDLGLRGKFLIPICKAINKQVSLYHVNLSGNRMTNESVQCLCSSLHSLSNLAVLNLSSNNLNATCLEAFVNMFTESSCGVLENLSSLDLSYNPLGDESLRHLAVMTRYLRLKNLKLTCVDFTGNIFQTFSNQSLDLCFNHLVNFDVSYNKMGKRDILKFLSWIKPGCVQSLDVSNNVDESEKGLLKGIVEWIERGDRNGGLKLEDLNLTRCNVHDAETYDLQRVMVLTNSVKSLNLSNNKNLTSLSLRAISDVRNLNVTGCETFISELTNSGDIFDGTELRQLKLSCQNDEEKEKIISAWKKRHRDNAQIVQGNLGYLHLSSNND